MQVNSINNGQNFGLRLSKDFFNVARQTKNRLAHKYGLNSEAYKGFIQTIKDIKAIKSDDVIDTYRCSLCPDVVLFRTSNNRQNNRFSRFENNDALFQNILNFLKVSN